MVGISQAMIALLEADNTVRKKSPRLELLIRISNALDVCCNDILHFHCRDCSIYETCTKRQYLEDDDDDFFENNIIYYL